MDYIAEIHLDHDAECPNDYDGMFKLHSFNSRHNSFTHPDEIDREDIAFVLSYYEHGACRWMVGRSTVPDYGGFDTVQVAGVLTLDPEHKDWFNQASKEDQLKWAESFVDEYTHWANGYVYGVILKKASTTCGACDQEVDGEEVDACWGLVGRKYAESFPRTDMGVTDEDTLTIVDRTYG